MIWVWFAVPVVVEDEDNVAGGEERDGGAGDGEACGELFFVIEFNECEICFGSDESNCPVLEAGNVEHKLFS